MSVDVSKLDFTKLACNVMALQPKQDPLEVFDVLSKYEEFYAPTPMLNRKKILKYIVLVYDKNSPLHDEFKDMWRKKMFAADLAGFVKEENGKYLGKVEDMMKCKNTPVNSMIIRYVMLMRSSLYSKFTILQEVYFNVSEGLLGGNTKIDDFNKINKELEQCESELLSNDNLLSDDLTKYYFQDKLELRPEDIAKKLANGEQPIDIKEIEAE